MRGFISWSFVLILIAQTAKTNDWSIVFQSPTPFFTSLLVASIIITGVLLFFFEREYRGKLNSRDGRIEQLKGEIEASRNDYHRRLTERDERIEQKEYLINELRIRIGEIEPDSIYKNLRNESLKARALNHIRNIRDFIQCTESDEEYQQRQSINLNVLAADDRASGEFRLYNEGQQYWDCFNTETQLLKDELKKRLPPNQNCEDCQYQLLCNMSYRDPFGIQEVRRITDDLERLANSLVINQPSDTSSQTYAS